LPATVRIVNLIDIGVNLSHASFDPDREAVIQRASDAGVAIMIVTGSSRDSSHAARDVARTRPDCLYATAGVHPHHAKDFGVADLNWIRDLSRDPQVVAVGECGLDFFRNFSPQADQERAFHHQLEAATDNGLPVFLHQRDAHETFCAILDEHLGGLSGAVAHCFTGQRAELDHYLERGLMIGITGWICDERRGHHLRDLIAHIPPDRLMIETDAPYLLPRDLDPRPRSRRNEPMYLPHILDVIATVTGQPVAEMAEQTRRNTVDFFGLGCREASGQDK